MKLKTNNIVSIDDMHHGAFSSLGTAFYNKNYELSVDEDCNLTAVAIKDAQYMPKIEIDTTYYDRTYYYSPKLIFPNLDYNDMEFHDEIAYWINKWNEIGRLMTQLINFSYCPDEWGDEE